jgi:hypothetical protein
VENNDGAFVEILWKIEQLVLMFGVRREPNVRDTFNQDSEANL